VPIELEEKGEYPEGIEVEEDPEEIYYVRPAKKVQSNVVDLVNEQPLPNLLGSLIVGHLNH
jgi:hypothetical protein